MKTLTSLFFALFFLTTVSLNAQNADNNDVVHRSNELGFNIGSTTGMGLAFRHWSNKFGVQLAAIPIKANDFQFVSGGLTGLYSITNKKYHRFFLYLGNHVLITNDQFFYEDEVQSEIKYNVGFGTGFEVGKSVRFNIMLGYGAYNILGGSDYKLLPAIETGLYFKL